MFDSIAKAKGSAKRPQPKPGSPAGQLHKEHGSDYEFGMGLKEWNDHYPDKLHWDFMLENYNRLPVTAIDKAKEEGWAGSDIEAQEEEPPMPMKKRGRKKGTKGKCSYCKQEGHYKRNCPQLSGGF